VKFPRGEGAILADNKIPHTDFADVMEFCGSLDLLALFLV